MLPDECLMSDLLMSDLLMSDLLMSDLLSTYHNKISSHILHPTLYIIQRCTMVQNLVIQFPEQHVKLAALSQVGITGYIFQVVLELIDTPAGFIFYQPDIIGANKLSRISFYS